MKLIRSSQLALVDRNRNGLLLPLFVLVVALLVLPLGQQVIGEPITEKKDQRSRESGHVRTDLYGDPLPPGAIARLGTMRLRQGLGMYRFGVTAVAFAPNNKILASAGYDRRVRL